MIILRDTRERKGWNFFSQSTDVQVVDRKLDTGDYTVEGIEQDLAIERKACVGEIARNIVSKTFEKELIRLADIKHSFLIFEFSWKDIEIFPVNSGIPRRLWSRLRITPKFLFNTINKYRLKYNIHCIACNNVAFAEQTAFDLMRLYYEHNRRSN